MKLEDQVCSLELSRRLKELGCEQESLWYWWQLDKSIQRSSIYHDWIIASNPIEDDGLIFKYDNEISAFTVAEVGEMLPKEINEFELRCLKLGAYKNKWQVAYWELGEEDEVRFREYVDTEANARAKMIVYFNRTEVN